MNRPSPELIASAEAFADHLGWPGLELLEHRIPADVQARLGCAAWVWWFEAAWIPGVWLQLNQHLLSAAVYAVRFRVVSGWYPLELASPEQARQESEALHSRLAFEWFSTPAGRKQLRARHPECKGYTWPRLRERGAPYPSNRLYDPYLEPAVFAEALERGLSRATLLSWRAQAHAQRGDSAAGLRDVDEAVTLAGESLDLLWLRAWLRERNGDLAGALADVESIIRLEPDNAWSYGRRVELLQQMGKTARAEADRRTAAKLRSSTETANDK